MEERIVALEKTVSELEKLCSVTIRGIGELAFQHGRLTGILTGAAAVASGVIVGLISTKIYYKKKTKREVLEKETTKSK